MPMPMPTHERLEQRANEIAPMEQEEAINSTKHSSISVDSTSMKAPSCGGEIAGISNGHAAAAVTDIILGDGVKNNSTVHLKRKRGDDNINDNEGQGEGEAVEEGEVPVSATTSVRPPSCADNEPLHKRRSAFQTYNKRATKHEAQASNGWMPSRNAASVFIPEFSSKDDLEQEQLADSRRIMDTSPITERGVMKSLPIQTQNEEQLEEVAVLNKTNENDDSQDSTTGTSATTNITLANIQKPSPKEARARKQAHIEKLAEWRRLHKRNCRIQSPQDKKKANTTMMSPADHDVVDSATPAPSSLTQGPCTAAYDAQRCEDSTVTCETSIWPSLRGNALPPISYEMSPQKGDQTDLVPADESNVKSNSEPQRSEQRELSSLRQNNYNGLSLLHNVNCDGDGDIDAIIITQTRYEAMPSARTTGDGDGVKCFAAEPRSVYGVPSRPITITLWSTSPRTNKRNTKLPPWREACKSAIPKTINGVNAPEACPCYGEGKVLQRTTIHWAAEYCEAPRPAPSHHDWNYHPLFSNRAQDNLQVCQEEHNHWKSTGDEVDYMYNEWHNGTRDLLQYPSLATTYVTNHQINDAGTSSRKLRSGSSAGNAIDLTEMSDDEEPPTAVADDLATHFLQDQCTLSKNDADEILKRLLCHAKIKEGDDGGNGYDSKRALMRHFVHTPAHRNDDPKWNAIQARMAVHRRQAKIRERAGVANTSEITKEKSASTKHTNITIADDSDGSIVVSKEQGCISPSAPDEGASKIADSAPGRDSIAAGTGRNIGTFTSPPALSDWRCDPVQMQDVDNSDPPDAVADTDAAGLCIVSDEEPHPEQDDSSERGRALSNDTSYRTDEETLARRVLYELSGNDTDLARHSHIARLRTFLGFGGRLLLQMMGRVFIFFAWLLCLAHMIGHRLECEENAQTSGPMECGSEACKLSLVLILPFLVVPGWVTSGIRLSRGVHERDAGGIILSLFQAVLCFMAVSISFDLLSKSGEHMMMESPRHFVDVIGAGIL